jgi:uncharacterized protein YdhG (YjbR/CyaY superfamily)
MGPPRATGVTNHEGKGGLSQAEKDALKERIKEQKAEARRGRDRQAGERDLLDKVAELPEPDKTMAQRIHAIVTSTAPTLLPRTWYGMPAYANDAGNVVCFFTPASKFNERYASFGFNAEAKLDDGNMWPTAFALTRLTEADEARIAELVKRAVG